MGRHRTADEKRVLGERALALRAACNRLKAGSSEPCSGRMGNCQTRPLDRCENGPWRVLEKYSAVG